MGEPAISEDNYGLAKLRREFKRATEELEDCRKTIERLTDEIDTARSDEQHIAIGVAHYRDALTALGYAP